MPPTIFTSPRQAGKAYRALPPTGGLGPGQIPRRPQSSGRFRWLVAVRWFSPATSQEQWTTEEVVSDSNLPKEEILGLAQIAALSRLGTAYQVGSRLSGLAVDLASGDVQYASRAP